MLEEGGSATDKEDDQPDPERISPPEGKETLFSGRVVVVSSGDALTVLRDGNVIDLLLHGVDCPEPGQPFHDEARAFATRLCFDRTVNVRPVRTDPRGRTVAIVYLEDRRELNYELLKAGLAWYHRRFAVDDMYDAAERHARRAGRGLWGQPDPTPPWKYRRRGPPFR